jgi:hypothetical protein
VFDRLDIPLHIEQLDATNDPTNTTHENAIFLQLRGDEVDRAWSRIADVGIQRISREDVVRLGKDPEYAIQPPESWGWEGDYMAEIEVFHQLHCLNALRKGLVTNYHHYWGSRYGWSPPVNFERHLSHCLDMIRQSLMCHSDVEAITYVWRETQAAPYPDFGVRKVCRDFETVREWNERAKLKDAHRKWMTFAKPADAKQLSPPPGLADLKPTGWRHGEEVDIPVAPLNIETPGCPLRPSENS